MKRVLLLLLVFVLLLTGCSEESIDYNAQFKEDFNIRDWSNYTLEVTMMIDKDVLIADIVNTPDFVHITGEKNKDAFDFYTVEGKYYSYNNDTLIEIKEFEYNSDLSSLFDVEITGFKDGYYVGTVDVEIPDKGKKSCNAIYSKLRGSISCSLTSGDTVTIQLSVSDIGSTESGILPVSEEVNEETLGQYSFELNKVKKPFLQDLFRNYNIKEPSNKCYKELLNILNKYSSTEFLDSLDSYENWGTYKREALAYLIRLDIFDINSLAEYGADVSELAKIINSL